MGYMKFVETTPDNNLLREEVITFLTLTGDRLSSKKLEAGAEMIGLAVHNETRTGHFERAWDKFRGVDQPERNEAGGPPFTPGFFIPGRRA